MGKLEKQFQKLRSENITLLAQLKDALALRQSAVDVLRLNILEASPFTVWACTRDFKIILWNKRCEHVYGFAASEAIGQSFLDLFVDEPEREEARKDCIAIIDEGKTCDNFLAYDNTRHRQRRTMLTNCFRVWDAERNAFLQAEVGLVIEDDLVGARHKLGTIRELGQARLKEQQMLFTVTKENLRNRTEAAYEKACTKLLLAEQQWEHFVEATRRKLREVDGLRMLEKARWFTDRKTKLEREKERIVLELTLATTMEHLLPLASKVDKYYEEAQSDLTSYEPQSIPTQP